MKYFSILFAALMLPAGLSAQTAIPKALVVANDGTILVATSSPGASGMMRMKITGYNPDGSLRGTIAKEIDASTPLLMQTAVSENGEAVMTGTGGDAQSPHDIVTYGFDISTFVAVDEPGAAHAFALSPAYPNPVAGTVATVQFETGRTTTYRLFLRDIAGREVEQIDSGVLPAGNHERSIATNTLKAGTYFVVFESPGGTQTRKLLVVR